MSEDTRYRASIQHCPETPTLVGERVKILGDLDPDAPDDTWVEVRVRRTGVRLSLMKGDLQFSLMPPVLVEGIRLGEELVIPDRPRTPRGRKNKPH